MNLKHFTLLSGLLLTSHLYAADTTPAPLTTEQQQFSYAVGLNVGNSLEDAKSELDMAVFIQGMEDALAGKSEDQRRLTNNEADQIITRVINRLRIAEEQNAATILAQKQAAAKTFFSENALKDGIKTTPSGLQYRIVDTGDTQRAAVDDQVTVHYKGTLINGKVFDSSYEREIPVGFSLNSVIPGWTEGLQLIGVGGKIQLFIPPDLGYGDSSPPNIPSHSVLLFDVELLKIERALVAPATPPKKTKRKKR